MSPIGPGATRSIDSGSRKDSSEGPQVGLRLPHVVEQHRRPLVPPSIGESRVESTQHANAVTLIDVGHSLPQLMLLDRQNTACHFSVLRQHPTIHETQPGATDEMANPAH